MKAGVKNIGVLFLLTDAQVGKIEKTNLLIQKARIGKHKDKKYPVDLATISTLFF